MHRPWKRFFRKNHSLESFTELKKFTRLPVYYKRIQLRISQMEEMHKERVWGKSFHALSGYTALSVPPCVHQPDEFCRGLQFPSTHTHILPLSLPIPHTLEFLQRLHYVGMIDWMHWPLMNDLTSRPSSLPGRGGMGIGVGEWKFQPSHHIVVFLATSPHPVVV